MSLKHSDSIIGTHRRAGQRSGGGPRGRSASPTWPPAQRSAATPAPVLGSYFPCFLTSSWGRSRGRQRGPQSSELPSSQPRSGSRAQGGRSPADPRGPPPSTPREGTGAATSYHFTSEHAHVHAHTNGCVCKIAKKIS